MKAALLNHGGIMDPQVAAAVRQNSSTGRAAWICLAIAWTNAGLWQLLASLILSPFIYFIGLVVLVGLLGVAGQV